jgi:hypothetical protein
MKVYPDFRLAYQAADQHGLLNGDRAVSELRLRPNRSARHDTFLFCAMLGHTPEDTSPAGHDLLAGYGCKATILSVWSVDFDIIYYLNWASLL